MSFVYYCFVYALLTHYTWNLVKQKKSWHIFYLGFSFILLSILSQHSIIMIIYKSRTIFWRKCKNRYKCISPLLWKWLNRILNTALKNSVSKAYSMWQGFGEIIQQDWLCRESGFSSYHPHILLQLPVTLVIGNLMSSSGLQGLHHVCSTHELKLM